MRTGGARVWQGAALLCCVLFLVSVAGYYQPDVGFTTLLGLAEDGHEWETPTLQAIPHHHFPPQHAYDGSQYVQLALHPLLRDPAIDRALDNPAYRARRILFSWTAWAAGLGRPAWVVQAYAVQNIVFWLVLAAVMTRWLRPVSARMFALWFAVMFSDGLLASVRLSLLDGPSMLLLALALAAADANRTWTSAAIVGVAGLGRETNLLGAVGLPMPGDRREWLRAVGALVVVALPLLIWQDYVWSIYRASSAAEGLGHITPPLLAYARKWQLTLDGVAQYGLWSYHGTTLVIVFALTIQAVYLAWTVRGWTDPWWRLAAAYAVLMLVVDYVVWEGTPGAITRVVLPLTFGFNVLLTRESRTFWPWYVAGNLHLVGGIEMLVDTVAGW
jgi:hypothetical protein